MIPRTRTTRLGRWIFLITVVWNSLPLHLHLPSISRSQFVKFSTENYWRDRTELISGLWSGPWQGHDTVALFYFSAFAFIDFMCSATTFHDNQVEPEPIIRRQSWNDSSVGLSDMWSICGNSIIIIIIIPANPPVVFWTARVTFYHILQYAAPPTPLYSPPSFAFYSFITPFCCYIAVLVCGRPGILLWSLY